MLFPCQNDAGQMLVSPAKGLLMEEISPGLDSSTTYQIVNSIGQSIHILKGTAVNISSAACP